MVAIVFLVVAVVTNLIVFVQYIGDKSKKSNVILLNACIGVTGCTCATGECVHDN
jgi:hypothetical protein